jgi:glucosamine-6-phosphate deaminase
VLGLATGSTPTTIYKILIEKFTRGELSFANCICFNLDEYLPMDPSNEQSYHKYMNDNLFAHIDMKKENIWVPRGDIPASEVLDYCQNYEKAIREAGGLDIQLLGIGRTGHIGFNEPGSVEDTITRMVSLDP